MSSRHYDSHFSRSVVATGYFYNPDHHRYTRRVIDYCPKNGVFSLRRPHDSAPSRTSLPAVCRSFTSGMSNFQLFYGTIVTAYSITNSPMHQGHRRNPYHQGRRTTPRNIRRSTVRAPRPRIGMWTSVTSGTSGGIRCQLKILSQPMITMSSLFSKSLTGSWTSSRHQQHFHDLHRPLTTILPVHLVLST